MLARHATGRAFADAAGQSAPEGELLGFGWQESAPAHLGHEPGADRAAGRAGHAGRPAARGARTPPDGVARPGCAPPRRLDHRLRQPAVGRAADRHAERPAGRSVRLGRGSRAAQRGPGQRGLDRRSVAGARDDRGCAAQRLPCPAAGGRAAGDARRRPQLAASTPRPAAAGGRARRALARRTAGRAARAGAARRRARRPHRRAARLRTGARRRHGRRPPDRPALARHPGPARLCTGRQPRAGDTAP